MAQIQQTLLMGGAILLAFLILAAMVRVIRGPRFTDRIVAVNMINTMVVAIICILSVYMKQDYLVDVAVIYALLSFLTIVVLGRIIITRSQRHKERAEKEEAGHGA